VNFKRNVDRSGEGSLARQLASIGVSTGFGINASGGLTFKQFDKVMRLQVSRSSKSFFRSC
jgi:hypothetical protein